MAEEDDDTTNNLDENCEEIPHSVLHDRVRVGTKGCGSQSASVRPYARRRHTCKLCGKVGHNRKTCARARNVGNTNVSHEDSNIYSEDFGIPDYDESREL
ncbi:Zinc finger, CCHC-type superfamily [Sesbania bispinosa]|nr:Zinc finger, CCHC-type superfamily [Sesbania bispinosa]